MAIVFSHARPSTLMLRWFALGAAGGAALTMLLHVIGMEGPWQGAALVLALLAMFALIAMVYGIQQRERQLEEISDRARRDEVELDQMQRELDRHTQLEQDLRLAKQAADSAVLAKGEFLATMSHEIRTPLNGIVPMLDMLMQARLAPDHAELVRTAYLSSQQMLRIVDDILDYSKLEANRLELETTSFNLRELLESVMQLMERPAQSKALRLLLQIEPSVRLPVRGDPVRLRQVIGNLVSNAVKFTDRGSVSLSVRRVGETAAHHQLRFEVRDTGIGIPPEAQPRLFQAFSQADASTTRIYGGTGLGLAISKRIVDLMGGQIGVDSDPGHGATFWFEIPLLKVHGDMPSEVKTQQGGRLLLLSADPRLRLRLGMLLPNWGLRVNAVETTQEALDRLRTAANQGPPWAYSIILADLAGMRHTALALHRNLGRQSVYGDLRLVCLYGDDPVPEELRRSVTLLSRQAPDADLRAVLLDSAPPRSGDEAAAPAQAHAAAPAHARAPAPSADAQAPAADGVRYATRRPRVLLVEDNPVNLMVGQRLLGVLGITSDTAANGEAALLRMSASRYDIVLMDCQMPVMDGYTATRRWRETEEAAGDGRHLPIIAMTANAMTGDRQKCLDAGMDDYLPKPVTRSELERALHRWFDPEQPPLPVERGVTADAPANASAPAFAAAGDAGAPAETPHPPGLPELENTRTMTAQKPQPPILDEDILEELRTMLGDEVDRLVDIFLEDTPRLVGALENAAVGPDYDALRDAAHSLKSSSANLGAMSLSAAAKRVELAARERSLDRPVVAVALIANEFKRAKLRLLGERVARQGE